MNNKGQGLSLNTIIIAIIVLVVLVVLILIFTGYFENFTNTIAAESCAELGGQCVSGSDGSACPAAPFGDGNTAYLANGNPSCQEGGAQQVCCSLT